MKTQTERDCEEAIRQRDRESARRERIETRSLVFTLCVYSTVFAPLICAALIWLADRRDIDDCHRMMWCTVPCAIVIALVDIAYAVKRIVRG